MAQIAFVPHPQMGHINPTVKLARRLKEQGHQVLYLGIADLEEYISSQGLGFLPILTTAFPKGSLARQARMKLGWSEMWNGVLKDAVAEFGGALRKARPDLLLIDFLLQDLALLARAEHVPCVLISTSLDEFRLSLVDGGEGLADKMPVLTLCPRDFDFPHAVPRKGRYHLEASIDLERQEPGGFPWHRLDQDRPLIFCTLGSHCEDYEDSESFFRAVIEAMEKKPDWQLLLALGNPHADPADFQPVPPNVVLVNWAPQLAILERASIMMTHGGLGTVKECIYFGVPMIVFPVAWDQPENAARVSHHGLGVQGSIRSSAQQILHLIERVAGDSSFKACAQSMSRIFREIEARGAGARLIEMIVGSVQKDGRV